MMLYLGRYAVEGINPDGDYAADGEQPPFRIHDAEVQGWLQQAFDTRVEAESFMRQMRANPRVGERCACSRCGQELEWNGENWWDRGGGHYCGPYKADQEIVREDYTKPHAPNWSQFL